MAKSTFGNIYKKLINEQCIIETFKEPLTIISEISDKFYSYWALRKCKATDNVNKFNSILMNLLEGFCPLNGKENGVTYLAMYILIRYNAEIADFFTIPRGKDINKDEYINDRSRLVSAWNNMSKIVQWDKFKSNNKEFALAIETKYK